MHPYDEQGGQFTEAADQNLVDRAASEALSDAEDALLPAAEARLASWRTANNEE
jgi:hypothetical protein